jgi:hydroxypyruvate reductase
MSAPADLAPGAQFLDGLFRGAVQSVHPDAVVAAALPKRPTGRIFVLGAGKASAAMAAAVERAWSDVALEGLVVTRYGHGASCDRIRIVEAQHPVPDAAGSSAARETLAIAAGAEAGDLVLCLMSGGGSALLALPQHGISLADKQELSRKLLSSGAPIGDMNRVRIALSAIKGGRLALAARPAKVVTLVISDIPGDDAALVASGPSIQRPVPTGEALSILDRWSIDAPDAIKRFLQAEPINPSSEMEASGDLEDVSVVAAASTMLDAAAKIARAREITPIILGDRIEGEARFVAAEMARQIRTLPRDKPCVLLSGGETTVVKRGTGRGGRNSEFLLALAASLDGYSGYHAIACDSDGIDGSEENAGARASCDTLVRARAKGLDPWAYLANNDSYSFFDALGDLVFTGPTRTNVNDFRAVLIDPVSG